jgi:hypothetical protein
MPFSSSFYFILEALPDADGSMKGEVSCYKKTSTNVPPWFHKLVEIEMAVRKLIIGGKRKMNA